MKLLAPIWNFKLPSKDHQSLRQRALRWLAGFLIVMFLFTILSRAANAMTIPRVDTDKAAKKTIEHLIKQEGKITADGEQAVTTVSGLKIKAVHAAAGMQVEEGTPLVELDMDDIAEKAAELQTELKKHELSIADANYNRNLQENERSASITRAQEDYNYAAAESGQKIDMAKAEMDEAYRVWQEAKNNPDSEAAEDEASLRAVYEEKQALYNESVTARDQALRDASRAIDDARKGSTKDSTADATALDKEAVAAKLAKYRDLQEKKGMIEAAGSGTITFIDAAVVTGGITPETSLMLVSDTAKGLRFTAALDEEQQKYIAVGDNVSIITADNQEIQDVTVQSMAPNAEDPTIQDIVVNLGDSEKVKLYDTATMRVAVSSKAYSTCIPKSALRKGQNGESDYVLALKETKTVLGTQLAAEKLTVTVQEQNESFAALVDGEITSDQLIVVGSDKEIQAGDRVRLAESNE